MKKFLFLLALIAFLGLSIAASELPPALPSSLYGYASASCPVTVFVGAQQVAKTQTFAYQGRQVYAVDVPMDNFQAATLATIRLCGRQVATVKLTSGTNQQVNLSAPRAWWWR